MRELTIKQILGLLRKHLIVLVAVPVATVLLAFAAFAVLAPGATVTYTSEATFYVNTVWVEEKQINVSTIAADFNQLAVSRTVHDETAAKLNMKSLSGYTLKVTLSSGSRFIKLTCSGPDANTAYAIAYTVSNILVERATQISEVQSLTIFDGAKEPDEGMAGEQNSVKGAILVGAVALLVMACIIIVPEMLNTRVKTAEDVEEGLGLWVMAQIPNDEREGK